jgi:hypothetical protein
MEKEPRGIRQGVTKKYRRIEGFQTGKQKLCSYDRHPFDVDKNGERILIPIVDYFDASKGCYHAYRAACSAACAKSFIIEQKGADTALRLMWQRQMMIDHGKWAHNRPIPRARTWEEIEGNLGNIPIKEWRASAGLLRTTIIPEAVVPYQVFIEEEHEVTKPALDDVLGSFSLKGLARPPDEYNLKTKEEFLAKYPGHISEDVGAFQKWLDKNECNLPTDEQCEQMQNDFNTQRKDERKRKAEAKANST